MFLSLHSKTYARQLCTFLHNKTVTFMYAITSHNATKNDATQGSIIS